MNKFNEKIKEIVSSVKDAIKLFPITNIVAIIITFLVTFFIMHVKEPIELIEDITHVLCLAIFGIWFSEVLFNKPEKIPFKIAGFTITAVLSLVFKHFIDLELEGFPIIYRLVYVYAILSVLISIYVLIKRSNEKIEKYFLNLFLNLKKTAIIYGIVALGILTLYGIFTVLIFDDLDFDYISKILTLFAGLYAFPLSLRAFSNYDGEDTKFNKGVFSKVLLPLIFMAIVIVYMYIAKILFVTELPKNEVFKICVLIFITAYPIYLINKNYIGDNKVFSKIVNFIPYVLIPIVLLEVYSMGIRISQYGLTSSRYSAIIFIIVESLFIALTIVNKSKYLRESILALCLITCIVLIGPLNYFDFPEKSQLRIVKKYIDQNVKFENLSEEDQKKFAGAYRYLSEENKDKFNIDQTESEKLLSYNIYSYYYDYEEDDDEDRIIVVIEENDLNNVDISEYSRIYKFYRTYKDSKEDVYQYKLEDYDQTFEIDVNIKELVEKLIEANEISELTADRVYKENIIYPIDNNTSIYVSRINIRYYSTSKEIYGLSFDGYILEK